MNPWSWVSASGLISGLPQNCQPQFRTAQFTECWNEQCSVIPNQRWQHVRLCVICPALQITKFFSSVTWWWVIPSDWKDWIGAYVYLGSPLAFSTQPLRRESGSGRSPLGNRGENALGRGVCVCVHALCKWEYLPGPGAGWHSSVEGVFDKVLMQFFIGHSPSLRINPVN